MAPYPLFFLLFLFSLLDSWFLVETLSLDEDEGETTMKNTFIGSYFPPPKVRIGGSFSIGGSYFKPPLLPPPLKV